MDLIAKKYRVLKTLGQGAMGEVFLVLPPRGDPVALKLLKTSENSNQQSAIEQFENEFKVLKKLSHPNIGRIFDYGFDAEQKKVYFTSPWLKGSDLFAATRDLPFEKCEEYFVQILRALNYLHQKNIIHCDLKPGNIFVEGDSILLIDFGLAGYWGESIVGTPTYLAPEIYRGEHHTVTSDLYAVGVVFYNCLTRTQPFSGKSLQEVYDRHRTHTPPPITHFNSKVPKYFSDIASTLLAKKPEERYSSAAAVIEDIAAFSKTKYSVETPETLLSYLPTTAELIGRKEIQWRIENQVKLFLADTVKTPYIGVFIHGEHGVGKSKFLNQVKTHLQLEKIAVEEALLPLGESDKKMLMGAQAIFLEDVGDYLTQDADGKPNPYSQPFQDFLSFLEQKILSPDTERLLFVVTGTDPKHWKPFEKLFPREEFQFESVAVPPFTLEEMRVFLETITGQKEIPERFINEIYRDTGGNPEISQNIIEKLIQEGFLFDESGRWSSDLLARLAETLQKMETPRSLEEKLQFEYAAFSAEEKEIVEWLALAPHGLSEKTLSKLLGGGAGRRLKAMTERKILRQEENQRWVLYRSAFIPYLQKNLPSDDQKTRNERIAKEAMDLTQLELWHHLSYGRDRLTVQSALENLGRGLARAGQREAALEAYERLNLLFVDVPLPQRMDWAVKASELLIWLDRFREAEALLGHIEREISIDDTSVSLKSKLLLWEKKGMSLLHQQKIDQASLYFSEGLKLAASDASTRIEEIRFLNDLAQIALMTGQVEDAISQFETARKMASRLDPEELERITNNDLGHVYYRIRDYDKAISLLKEDVKVFEGLSYQEPLARALYTLAESLRATKKIGKAVSEYERCIQICQKEHLLPMLLRAYNGLGNVHLVAERSNEALKSYQKAVEISVRLKDRTTKAALLANQGLIYRRASNWPQAARRFLLAKQILEGKEQKLAYESELLSKCYNELTDIAKEEKDNMKALSFHLERMRMVENSQTLKAEEFSVKLELAELYLQNRLVDPLEIEMKKLEDLAKTEDQKGKLKDLKKRFDEIQDFDQDSTMKFE